MSRSVDAWMRASVLALLLACLLGGCLGETARRETLLPAMRTAWVGVRADAQAGGATESVLAALDEALAAGDPVAVQLAWPPVAAAARASLAGLSTGLAEFRGERIDQFQRAVEALNHGQ